MDTRDYNFLLVGVLMFVIATFWVVIDIRDTVRDYTPPPFGEVEEIEVNGNKRVFTIYKLECKAEHGAEYIDRYMRCAHRKMVSYLQEDNDNE